MSRVAPHTRPVKPTRRRCFPAGRAGSIQRDPPDHLRTPRRGGPRPTGRQRRASHRAPRDPL